MSAHPRAHRYELIADEIRESIRRGAYEPEGRLPSERRLVRTFEAQRNTVRQALGLLEREGRIESVGKSGWFVAAGGSAAARDLSGQRVLLVTFRRRSSASIDTLAIGLRETLSAQGIQLLRYDSSGSEEAEHIATAQQLTTVDAGGIVMWPHNPVDAKLLSRLQASSPLILVDRRVFGFECDSVRFDDLGGGRMLTEHLIAQGHKRIAYLADEPFVESVQSRWYGYRQALEAANIVPDDNLTVITYGRHEPTFSANVEFLLKGLPVPPSAIVCSNDSVASNLLLLLREWGIRVPQDVAVAGFGNEAPGYLDVMDLTSVTQSFVELGRAAGALLLERLSEPPAKRNNSRKEICIPMTLAIRGSSGRPT